MSTLLLVLVGLDFISNCYIIYRTLFYKSKVKSTTARRKSIPKAIRRALLDASGSKCANCARECCSPHIDHVLPVALGGSDEIDNLQVLCAACNLHKGARKEIINEQSA